MTNVSDDVTYQYRNSKGEEFWIAFDPERRCIYCEEPVRSLSMGGPAICGLCDCGRHRDGTPWSHHEWPALQKRAWRNLDAMMPKLVGSDEQSVRRSDGKD